MKIIFSNFDDISNPFYGGGGAKAIHEVATRLARQHQVTVLTARYPGALSGCIEGVNYERIGAGRAGPKLGQVLFPLALCREVRRRSFDIWVENSTPPFSTSGLQAFSRKPVVFLAMNLSGRDMTAKYHVPMHLVENLGLKFYRHAIAVTETMREEMLKANPALEVQVIPNGVDQALIDQPPAEGGDSILFLGRIDVRHKGLDLLLDAYKTIEHETEVPLLVAGAGLKHDEAFLRQRIVALNLDARISCLGKVVGKLKDQTFRRAMVYAAPSRCEGVPLAIMEAASYGLPLVIFGIPDLRWIPDSICLRIPPFDIKAYGQALLALSRDKALRERMSRAAKRWIRDFSWDSIAGQYEKCLVSAAANPTNARD